jgi:nitroreductase
MNETMNTILTRRSIRKFTDKPIPKEILEDLVKAALHAPSGMGKQTWKFTVITNKDAIKRLADAIQTTLNRPGYNMYCPAAVIMPSNLRDSNWGREDNACALENIFLAARSYGVGSVWINQMQNICDTPAIREILDDFGVPADHVVYGMAALGYPNPDTEIQPKERIGQVAYIE